MTTNSPEAVDNPIQDKSDGKGNDNHDVDGDDVEMIQKLDVNDMNKVVKGSGDVSGYGE